MNEDVYTLYVYMQTCCWLQEVQVGVMGEESLLHHTFCNLFTLQLTCEKDVGMGLCTFNFVLRLSLHLSLNMCDASITTDSSHFCSCMQQKFLTADGEGCSVHSTRFH